MGRKVSCCGGGVEEEEAEEMNRQGGGGQRLRSARPTTIHDCALSGDLIALQRLLKDNPSLLNERNPVVCPFLATFLNLNLLNSDVFDSADSF